MKIALDFDNVLAETMMKWILHYNKKYHQHTTKSEITRYSFWGNNLPITKKDAVDIFKSVWAHWKSLSPTEEYLAAKVNLIADIHQVDIATSVIPTHIKYIERWIKKHKIPHNKIIQCETEEKTKLGYEVIIEDSPIVARDVSNAICLLYDQPWNRKIRGNNIIRIYKLKEAVSVLRAQL